MHFLELLLIAIALSMDACAVAVCVGSAGYAGRRRNIARLSISFGFFQFIMPVIGWFVGSRLQYLIASIDHWIAFGLLSVVGVRMIRSGFDSLGLMSSENPTRGFRLLALSVATSIDALAVGLSFSMLGLTVLYPSIIIGSVTCILSVAGMMFGNRLHAHTGKKLEIAGGLLLILIGLRILVTHLIS
jgi:manganese efflux pump family protein